MGHQRLGELPKSKYWDQVVALLASGADVPEIAAATSSAAEHSMIAASGDAAVRHAFFLLTQIPLAARQRNFVSALRKLGIEVGNAPTLIEVISAATETIDRKVLSDGRSDYGELAQLAFAESLHAIAAKEGDLWPASPERAKSAFADLARADVFAVLSRDFFARLTRRHLAYYLSRAFTRQAGPGRRFASLGEVAACETAIEDHCREASRIIKEFSAQWFDKHNQQGGISLAKAGRFVHVAAGKVREELRRRQRMNVNA
jgi:hypothetical protein